MIAADLEVERVVPGRHLQGAGAELRVDTLVLDHRHGALDEGHDHLAAHCVGPALVPGGHGHGHVGQDRGGPRRRDRDAVLGLVRERVAHVRERVVDLLVHELEIRECGLVVRAPVDDPARAVDPALAVEVDEEPHDGTNVGIVHREPLPPVVHRRAHSAELAHDRAAVLPQPVPDELDERLAAELLPGLAVLGQVLLDGVLGRDAGVVVAG